MAPFNEIMVSIPQDLTMIIKEVNKDINLSTIKAAVLEGSGAYPNYLVH